MNCRGTGIFFFALLEIGYCDLGVCLSLNGSLDMVCGAFYLVPHLNPGRPFCPVSCPRLPLWERLCSIFGQDWESAMGK